MALNKDRQKSLDALVKRVLSNQIPQQFNIVAAKQYPELCALADARGGGVLYTGALDTMHALIRASRTLALLDQLEALTPYELEYVVPRCQPEGVEVTLRRVPLAFEVARIAMGG